MYAIDGFGAVHKERTIKSSEWQDFANITAGKIIWSYADDVIPFSSDYITKYHPELKAKADAILAAAKIDDIGWIVNDSEKNAFTMPTGNSKGMDLKSILILFAIIFGIITITK